MSQFWQGAALEVWQSGQACLLSSLESRLRLASGSHGLQTGILPGRRLGNSSALLRCAASCQLGHQALHHMSPASRVHVGQVWQPVPMLDKPEDAAAQLQEVVLWVQVTSLTSAGWAQAFRHTTGRGCASQSTLSNPIGLRRVTGGVTVQLLASTISIVPVVLLLQASSWLLAVAGCSKGSPQAMQCSAVCSWRLAEDFAASWPLPPTRYTSAI